MNALFAYSARFVRDADSVYSEIYFPTPWARYLNHFSQILVAAREGNIPRGKTTDQLYLASADRVKFDLFPNLSTIRGSLLTRRQQMPRMRTLVEDCDAVIARLPSEMGLLAIQCAEQIGKPWAVELVGCAFDGLWHHGTMQGRLYAPLYYMRTRRAVRRAPFALYVTEEFLQSRYPTEAEVVANASNVEIPKTAGSVLARRRARIANRSNAPLRLGLIGSLQTRSKGIQIVMKALARARNRLPTITFHVLGDGVKRPWEELASRQGLQDIVHFEGTLPSGPAVFEWLDNIDVYLQPSLQEGLPRALIEAMSRGCPAIGSSRAGIPELLPKADLVKPGSAFELADLLERRLFDVEWMMDRSERNWEVAKRYDASVLTVRRDSFWRTFYCHAERLNESGYVINNGNKYKKRKHRILRFFDSH